MRATADLTYKKAQDAFEKAAKKDAALRYGH